MRLAQTPVLWFNFIATLLATAGFAFIMQRYGLVLVDEMSDPQQVRDTIASMTDSQRSLHAWVTATLDVFYPLVYGALFIGSAYKFFPSVARYVAMLMVLLIVVDLAEGLVQVLGLTGTADWLAAKAFLTPLKLALFVFGIVVMVCGWVKWLVNRFRGAATS